MKKYTTISIVVLLAGFAYWHLTSMSDMDHNDMGHAAMTDMGMGDMDHNHDELVELTVDVPTVELLVHKDPMKGYNAEIRTTNFNFRPESASTDHVDNDGHAHIYVNDVKLNRVYSNWYHLGPELFTEPGVYVVRAELSTNDHHTYGFEGATISAEQTIEVQ